SAGPGAVFLAAPALEAPAAAAQSAKEQGRSTPERRGLRLACFALRASYLVFTMLTGPNVILGLKVAVAAVTVLLLSSLLALARGNYRLHGRINLTFFTLTLIALFCFEVVIRIVDPSIFDYVNDE